LLAAFIARPYYSWSDTNPRRKLAGSAERPTNESVGIIFPKKARSLRSNERAKKQNGGEAKKNDFRIPHDV